MPPIHQSPSRMRPCQTQWTVLCTATVYRRNDRNRNRNRNRNWNYDRNRDVRNGHHDRYSFNTEFSSFYDPGNIKSSVPLACFKRWQNLNGAVCRMRSCKQRYPVIADVARYRPLPVQRPQMPSIDLNFALSLHRQQWRPYTSEIFSKGQ